MRVCRTCGIEKDESEFAKNKNYEDGLSIHCLECTREYGRNKYYERKERDIEGVRKNGRKSCKNRREKMKVRLNEHKTPCVKCGESRLYCIDFHHIDPSKKSFPIGMSSKDKSDEIFEAEIAKCVCLCKNCHSEFHHFFGKLPKEPHESLCEYLGREPSYVPKRLNTSEVEV